MFRRYFQSDCDIHLLIPNDRTHLVADQPSFPWPNGERAAVSLTFDDGVASQYETVIPMLNKRGFHGTVYIPMAEGGRF
ncbi:MAG TPA: hypothetical protein ENN56_00625, partial [Firmicutes bacterium]|nr:hypothetical protein [Bacillota bacterium]